MINLLPPKEKNDLFLKKIKNLVIILGGVILVFLICLILILTSIKFNLLSKISDQTYLSQETQNQYQSDTVITLKNSIQKYNTSIPQALSLYQSGNRISDVLGIISEIPRPQGLYFTNISIDGKSNNNKIIINITGVSPARDDLVAFQKNLEEESLIKNASFSSNSWISPGKTNFNLTLEF